MDAGIIAATFVVIILVCITVMLCLRCFKEPQLQFGSNQAALVAPVLSQSELNKLIAFLEEADDAYIRAYQYRTLGELIQFSTREMAIEIQQKITYYNDKIWGTPAHRQRNWSIVSTDGKLITVRKELTFKKVRYGRMLVKLGDDCVEYWKVIYDDRDKRYKIQEITC